MDIAQTRELNIPRVVVENGRIVVRVMPSQGLSDQIVDELKVTVNREEGSKNGG